MAGGAIEPPQMQIAAAQAWLQTPDEAHRVAADATLGEFANRQQELWEPEFEYLWGEASLWALQAAEACVVTVTHPQPAPWAARAVVATLKAVQLGYVDQAVEPLQRVCQWVATGALR